MNSLKDLTPKELYAIDLHELKRRIINETKARLISDEDLSELQNGQQCLVFIVDYDELMILIYEDGSIAIVYAMESCLNGGYLEEILRSDDAIAKAFSPEIADYYKKLKEEDRIASTRESQLYAEAKERAEYARLKQKFG